MRVAGASLYAAARFNAHVYLANAGSEAGSDRTRQIVVRADARSQTQHLVTVMDSLGQLGFTRINLATTPEATP